MKNAKSNALRWFREAEYTLRQARRTLERDEAYNWVCFLAEQVCQKSLKAVLFADGARMITIHSISVLVEQVKNRHPEFAEYADRAKVLDQYYLSARYPDAVAEPAIPSEIFIRDQAAAAIEIANAIFIQAQKTLGANNT